MVQSFTAFLSLTGNSRTLSFWGTGATDRFRITSISLLTSCISFGLFCSMDIRSASISANFLKLNTLPLLPGCSPVARYSIRTPSTSAIANASPREGGVHLCRCMIIRLYPMPKVLDRVAYVMRLRSITLSTRPQKVPSCFCLFIAFTSRPCIHFCPSMPPACPQHAPVFTPFYMLFLPYFCYTFDVLPPRRQPSG